MTCHPQDGCPSDTHNLHCAFPNCEKGQAEARRHSNQPAVTGYEFNLLAAAPAPRSDLRAIAIRVSALAIEKGWQKPEWSTNFVAKLAFAITELNEGVDWVHGRGKDPLSIELADTAIRLLAVIEGIWPTSWCPGRIEGRVRSQGPAVAYFQPIEVGVWPIVRHICEAIECWRKNDPKYGAKDAMISTELAILETFRLADRLGIDLMDEIEKKTIVNSLRPHLHGKGQDVG